MIKVKRLNDEVLFSREPLLRLGRSDVSALKARARRNPRKRIRLCAHSSEEDAVHEMLIVMARGTYVRPHKHLDHPESFHVVEGRADVVLFDDGGRPVSSFEVGDYASGRRYYYRLSAPRFHTLRLRSPFLVFHEAKGGPFRRADTVLAPWAPEDGDGAGARAFQRRLDAWLDRRRRRLPRPCS